MESVEPRSETLLSGHVFIMGNVTETGATRVERYTVGTSYCGLPCDLRFGLCQYDCFVHGIMYGELREHLVPHGIIEFRCFSLGSYFSKFQICGPLASSFTSIAITRIALLHGVFLHGNVLLSAAKERIGYRAIPTERPRETCQRHDQ